MVTLSSFKPLFGIVCSTHLLYFISPKSLPAKVSQLSGGRSCLSLNVLICYICFIYIYTHTHTHTHMCIHIYVYVYEFISGDFCHWSVSYNLWFQINYYGLIIFGEAHIASLYLFWKPPRFLHNRYFLHLNYKLFQVLKNIFLFLHLVLCPWIHSNVS